jgi:prophage regulatory protein
VAVGPDVVELSGIRPTKGKPDMRRIVRFRELRQLTGLGRSTVGRMEASGCFPRRVPLTHTPVPRVGWYEDEVAAWIESRRRAREEPS